jgi:hypothetical protein
MSGFGRVLDEGNPAQRHNSLKSTVAAPSGGANVRFRGLSGNALLQRECLLLTQSGGFKLAKGKSGFNLGLQIRQS